MQEELKNYLNGIGLRVSNLEIDKKFSDNLKEILETKPNKKEGVGKLLNYKVPKLTPDGSCSIAEELDDTPYNLKQIFQFNKFRDEDIYNLIYKINKAVELLHKEIGSDWTGIYKKLNTKSEPALVKLTYRGNPSRAEFPLTEKFAEHSNNSTVGLSGKAVLINDVEKHLKSGKPYYECDVKVKSELCVPIFSQNKEIIGIIDLESFQENFFDNKKILKIGTACILLSEEL